jgi:murein DD-endopeptidase MepM/ murein hydrolase activator NlpD
MRSNLFRTTLIILGLAGFGAASAAPTQTATVVMRPGETLAAALVRGGTGASDAAAATAALSDNFDVQTPHPGVTLRLSLSAVGAAGARLTALEMAPGPGEQLGLSREADGQLHLRRIQAPVLTAPTLTVGVVRGSLHDSIVAAGAPRDAAARIAGLFGRRLDLAHDIGEGDRFHLVFDHPTPGRAGELLYADLTTRMGVVRLYRYHAPGTATADWVDGDGDPRRSGLLRTPLDGARVTSAFGMRLHPLLGFTRLHAGVDFGAPQGSPVLAAADGVVEEARWDGDLGRWLKIRHNAVLETGYGHLSGWAAAAKPGARVRQGDVVAYVGATGLATGPHLHFEVFQSGRLIDPKAAPTLKAWKPDPAVDPDFKARKADIDATVGRLAAQCAAPGLFVRAPTDRCIG